MTKKGEHLSEESKKKISISKSGKSIKHNGQFKKGFTPWNKTNFNGTTYKELNHTLRTSKKWVEWRTQVFHRDEFTCQTCGKKGITIYPHHIVSVKQCVEINHIDLIYEVSNGITLCFDCHWQEHRKKYSEAD